MSSHRSDSPSRMRQRFLPLTLAVLALAACSPDNSGKKEQPVAETAPGTVRIGTEAIKAANIRISVAGPAKIRETITLYGTVKPEHEGERSVRARYAGTVRTVTKKLGDPVKRGETLMTVESSSSLQTYRITAPIAGTVIGRSVSAGETVGTDMDLMQIADLNRLMVEFAVFTRDLDKVHAGQPVLVAPSEGATPIETTLKYVAPVGKPGDQSVPARAEIDNAGGHFIIGRFVTGDVVVAEADAAVAVTPAAIQTVDGKPSVFVVVPGGFALRHVTLGHRSDTAVEIIKGLKAGERYASANTFQIKAEFAKEE